MLHSTSKHRHRLNSLFTHFQPRTVITSHSSRFLTNLSLQPPEPSEGQCFSNSGACNCYKAIFHSEGAFQSCYHYSFATYQYHIIIGNHKTGSPKPQLGAPKRYSFLTQTDIVAHQIHKCISGVQDINLFMISAMSTQMHVGFLPQCQFQQGYLHVGEGCPWCCLQHVVLALIPFWPFYSNVQSGSSHGHSRVNGHSHLSALGNLVAVNSLGSHVKCDARGQEVHYQDKHQKWTHSRFLRA
jgi:hypothetical protein